MAKLLQGSAVVTTPLNLLPNSLFTGFDRANVRHFDYVADSNAQSIISAGFGTGMVTVSLNVRFGNLSNVNITVADGGIRLQGNAKWTNTTSTCAVWIQIGYNIPNGKIMTVGCRSKNRKNIICSTPNIANAHNSYYRTPVDWATRNTSESKDSCQILMATNQTNAIGLVYQMAMRHTAIGEVLPFDITLYDFYVYEGAFTNPPITSSLDTKPRPLFLKSDLSNFPSKVDVFNFTQKNTRDSASLNNKTFLANKWYNLLRIATNDSMSGISYDGIEYINIRGVMYYPDTNQCEACAYELKIFWHEVSYSSYKGAHPVLIETPTIKVNTVYSGNNKSQIASFRLRKSSIQIYDLQWQVPNVNCSHTQSWVMEIDTYGRIINRLKLIPWDTEYNGSDYFTTYD